MNNLEIAIVLFAIGLFIGFMCGSWSENRLWLNAICGRERIWKSALDKGGDKL